MKKYTKPMIVFESFSLSNSIAACDNQVSYSESLGKNCKGYYDDQFSVVLFLHDYEGCEYVDQDDDPKDVNGLCYHVPTVSLNLFGS